MHVLKCCHEWIEYGFQDIKWKKHDTWSSSL